MKKLLSLTAVLMLLGSAGGCKICDKWFRGSAEQCPPQAVPIYSAAPSCDPCSPCGSQAVMAPSGGVFVPGPAG
jgi:hypothetical protein